MVSASIATNTSYLHTALKFLLELFLLSINEVRTPCIPISKITTTVMMTHGLPTTTIKHLTVMRSCCTLVTRTFGRFLLNS